MNTTKKRTRDRFKEKTISQFIRTTYDNIQVDNLQYWIEDFEDGDHLEYVDLTFNENGEQYSNFKVLIMGGDWERSLRLWFEDYNPNKKD